MVYEKGFHSHIRVLVNNPRLNLMHIDLVSLEIASLKSMEAHINILLVSSQDMLRHSSNTLGAIHLQWFISSQNPRCEDDVRITDRMIGM